MWIKCHLWVTPEKVFQPPIKIDDFYSLSQCDVINGWSLVRRQLDWPVIVGTSRLEDITTLLAGFQSGSNIYPESFKWTSTTGMLGLGQLPGNEKTCYSYLDLSFNCSISGIGSWASDVNADGTVVVSGALDF